MEIGPMQHLNPYKEERSWKTKPPLGPAIVSRGQFVTNCYALLLQILAVPKSLHLLRLKGFVLECSQQHHVWLMFSLYTSRKDELVFNCSLYVCAFNNWEGDKRGGRSNKIWRPLYLHWGCVAIYCLSLQPEGIGSLAVVRESQTAGPGVLFSTSAWPGDCGSFVQM